MIIFLYGKDTFRSREQLQKMIKKFQDERDPSGYNIKKFNCLFGELGNILEEIRSIPFLAEKKLIIIENLLASKNKNIIKEIKNYLDEKKIPESNIIIFREETDKFTDKTTLELFTILAKEKYAQKFADLAGYELTSWIMEKTKEKGGELEKTAAEFIAANLGSDTWHINSLLDQLINFESKKITSKAVSLFIEEKIDNNIFNLVDAVLAKDRKNSLKMIAEQYRLGEDAHYVLAMIMRQIRILLQIKDLLQREEIGSEQIVKKTGLHPYVVKKSLPFTKKYSFLNLKNFYEELVEIDQKSKSGQGDLEIMLDLFVGKNQ